MLDCPVRLSVQTVRSDCPVRLSDCPVKMCCYSCLPTVCCLYRLVESKPHTVWIDNFSKRAVGVGIPSIRDGSWKECLWTGVALREYTGPDPVSMDLLQDEKGYLVPAMPSIERLWACETELKNTWARHIVNLDFMNDSFSVKWGLDCVPIKLNPESVTSPLVRAAATGTHQNLDTLHPKELLKYNIGSNVGLARVLRLHYDNKKQQGNGCKQ